MSFDRKLLKDHAKQMLKKNYWPMVIAAFVLMLSTGAFEMNYSYKGPDIAESLSETDALIVLFGMIVGILVTLFVMHPLEYGASKFFVKNIDDEGTGTLLDGFRGDDLTRSAFTLFYRNLMIVLFTFLLIIPGVIKAYEYYFVPQLMAEHPELSGRDICRLSKDMTMGHKMDLFVLDLSFILWSIATSMTLGLVGIFYFYPYKAQVQALAYRDLVLQGADPSRPDGI